MVLDKAHIDINSLLIIRKEVIINDKLISTLK